MLLLNSAFLQQPVIANNFNHSLIKNRIKMITKIKSSKSAVLKLSMGIIATAALLIVFAFDKDRNLVPNKNASNKQLEVAVNDQQKSTKSTEPVFKKVDQMPVFPGGDKAFIDFITKEVKYPDKAKKAGIQGKVYVEFVINKEGNVVNSKIVRSASPSLNDEALRVINSMPNWTPGKNKGKNVDVQLTIPIAFILQ
jgi:TonB family protein